MKLQLLTVFSLLQLSAGDPRLVCEETVETRIGDNVTLRCHMEPEEIIQHEELEVTKVDSHALVYSYYNGRQLANDYDAYKHRTFLNTEELQSGVLNLKIFSVRQSDEGTYKIYIDKWRIRSTVTLVVGDPRLVCQETVKALVGYNVVIPCHLEPKQNIDVDEVEVTRVYTRRNGEQSPDQEDQYKHRTFVNFEDLKIGVLNLKIHSVRKSDEGTYKIYISKWGISSTVTLIVGDPPSDVPLGVVIGVIISVAVAFIVLGVGLVVLNLVKRKRSEVVGASKMMKIHRELQKTDTWTQDSLQSDSTLESE